MFYAKTCQTSWERINDNYFRSSINLLCGDVGHPRVHSFGSQPESCESDLNAHLTNKRLGLTPLPVLGVIPNRLRHSFPEGWWPGKATDEMDLKRLVDVGGMTTLAWEGCCG